MNRELMNTNAPCLLALAATLALPACQAPEAPVKAVASAPSDSDLLARGDYLVRTAGCNDCHTPGYAEAQGNIDKAQWLIGSPLGFKGPWGTTYAVNLRLTLADMDETQWLDFSSKLKTRPIMPDFAVRAMTVDDRRAIYRFIKSLGPGGQPAPAYLPPEQTPPLPYWELQLPPAPEANG